MPSLEKRQILERGSYGEAIFFYHRPEWDESQIAKLIRATESTLTESFFKKITA